MSFYDRLRVVFTGHYYCPDCYYPECREKCGRRRRDRERIISKIIGNEDYVTAEKLIDELEADIGDDPLVTGLRAALIFQRGDD